MLKNIVEKLVNEPHLMQQFKEDKLDLVGISETEKAAVLDVLTEKEVPGINIEKAYWK